MKLDEYLQKKRELEEAEKKMKEARSALKEEKKKEKVDKGGFWYGWKPYQRNDAIIVLIVVILFLVSMFYGPGILNSDDNEESFFSNLFSFSGNDVADNEEDTDGEDTDGEDTDGEDQDSGSDDTSEEDTDGEEINEDAVDYDLKIYYNNEEVSGLAVHQEDYVDYDVKLINNHGEKIKCEGYEYTNNVKGNGNSFSIESNEEKKLINTKARKDGDKVINMKYLFECFIDGDKDDTKLEKESSIRVTFS